ncbi:MAG: efflux RND transporter permease subunit [Deltaproteobacteria bacterium]|nr:efflux RND transporter permease subunit [Deltaproteobacteria bacterium]
MSGLVAWAAKNQLLALLFAIAVVSTGVWSAMHLPIDAVPDVTNTQVQVVTRAPALSAGEVELQVTQPVEREMAGLPGLVTTRSVTKTGISIVTLVFRDDIDIYFARSQVNERLLGVRDKVPSEVGRPELGPISTALGEIFMFELSAKNPARSTEELRTIVDWEVAPKLRQVPGVVEVVGFGGAAKQYQVTLDPARLSAHKLSTSAVRDALSKDNLLAGGGYMERDGEHVVLRGDARFRSLEDIASTVVRTDEHGVPVTIGQIGDVRTAPALRQGAMTRDGRGEVVGASVLMLKGQNSREVVARVREAVQELEPRLPSGVKFEVYYDRADFIDRVIATIAKNLSEGAVIVVLCLLFTLGSIRAGLLVAGAIPFSMLVGFIGLRAAGYSGNVMSLGAVDFGIIVEGAVLTVEHAMAHGAAEQDRERRRQRIIHAMQEVARPAVFVVIITLLVFLPLASLEDVEGKMFRPVVYSLCFMLVGAIVYALVVIPAIAPTVLRIRPDQTEPRAITFLKKQYGRALDRALVRPRAVLAVAFGATLALLLPASRMGADFMPRVFEGSFAIDAMRAPSVSLPQAIALGKETEQALLEVPEVETVVNRIGRPEDAVDPAGPEASDVFVILKPRSAWRPGLTPEALMNELSARVSSRVPGTVNAFSQPIEMRVNDLVAGVKSDVAVKVYGEDLDDLTRAGEEIRRALAKVPGASDFKVEIATGQPAVSVVVDRARVARLGVSARDVLDSVSMARAGVTVGAVREGERVFDLVVRLGGETVAHADDVARLPLVTPQGAIVPLGMAATVSEENTVVQISREQMRRRLVVQGNVRGRDMVGFVKEAQREVAKLEMPRGVEIQWGGQFQNFNRAKDRLALLAPIALAVIAVMLVVTFRSGKLTLITMLNLPFALAGGIGALALRGLPFSIPAGVGFIALAGVSVCTGIVMTTNFLSATAEDPATRVREAAVASFRARLSTALIAAVGFIPAAIATGAGAEVQRPLATVVIGGLIASMLLSLFALPAMLLLGVGKRPEGAVAPAPAVTPEPAAEPAHEGNVSTAPG